MNRNGNLEEVYAVYGREAVGSDRWLYQNSVNTMEIMKLLSEGHAHSVENRISRADVERQKVHVLTEQYKKKYFG